MSEPAERRMTIPEFLTWDDGTDQRYELVRGEVRPTPIMYLRRRNRNKV